MLSEQFKHDLTFGQHFENLLKELDSSGNMTCQAKADRMWAKTGNIAFEYESYGKPSGFANCESKWWAQAICDENGNCRGFFIVPAESVKRNLRRLLEEEKARDKKGIGENGMSNCVLLKVSDIYELLK